MTTAATESIHDYLERNQRKELLRFLTCGSVDDGKSTLIGRLLHDTKGIYEDQLAAVQRDSVRHGTTGAGQVDLALLTDGLKAEREQGITIDVAYRYFSTDKRKFIIADTPGHEQYTRNMATGASTAQLAIILIDARHGVLTQTRRHSFIVSLLGIRHVVVAINKLDLANYSQERFEQIKADYAAFIAKLNIPDIVYIPMSALAGDNVVEPSTRMPWYKGPTLLAHLENVPVARDLDGQPFRFPVQCVIRPNLDFRGFAGTIASGSVRAGDAVQVLPSGRRSRVKSIVTFDGDLPEAAAPRAVTLTLEDEIDISRGDILVHPVSVPAVSRQIDATVVWMNDSPLVAGKSYWIKHGTRLIPAEVGAFRHGIDVNTLEHRAVARLGLNEVAQVVFKLSSPLAFDPYTQNAATGAFIVIDRLTNNTVGAGMITGAAESLRNTGPVTREEREARLGQHGAVIVTPAELAPGIERALFEDGRTVIRFDHLPAEVFAAVVPTLVAQGLLLVVDSEAPPALPADIRVVHTQGTTVDAALAHLRQIALLGPEALSAGEGI